VEGGVRTRLIEGDAQTLESREKSVTNGRSVATKKDKSQVFLRSSAEPKAMIVPRPNELRKERGHSPQDGRKGEIRLSSKV